MPPIFSALDSAENERELLLLGQLRVKLGVIATTLQLLSNDYRGFKNADHHLSLDKLQHYSDACKNNKECMLKGKSFTVWRPGLFDVVSDFKPMPQVKTTNIKNALSRLGVQNLTTIFATQSNDVERIVFGAASTAYVLRKDGDGTCSSQGQTSDCFGSCGSGCIKPGDSSTSECRGHDYCVCAYGHGACIVDVPDDCGLANLPCSSLLDAIFSYIQDMLDNDGGEEECGFFGCSLGG